MRRVRTVIAGLLGLTVATFVGMRAASAANVETLSVTPGHGLSSAPFTVAYEQPVRLLVGPCSGSMTFTFDGAVLGDAPLARSGSSCAASLRTSPAPGTGPGPHTLRAAGTSVSATYTVDPAPSPAPSRSTSPSPVRASPTPSPAASSADPSESPAAQRAVDSTDGMGQGTPSPGVPVRLAGPGRSEATSTTTWVLAGGALLIVVDLAVLALLGLRGRRGERRTVERRSGGDEIPLAP